jgi:hypothetical protein
VIGIQEAGKVLQMLFLYIPIKRKSDVGIALVSELSWFKHFGLSRHRLLLLFRFFGFQQSIKIIVAEISIQA